MSKDKSSVYVLLIGMAFSAVLAESLLVPFYPQFFKEFFGIENTKHTGYYFSACRLVLLIGFPVWALISRNKSSLSILIVCQFLAGVLSLACYFSEDIYWFWVISLTMVFFKSSYLLIYPLLLQFVQGGKQVRTIGTLSGFMHLAILLSIWLGSILFQEFSLKAVFIIVALADFLQMILSVVLKKKEVEKELVEKQEKEVTVPMSSMMILYGIAFLLFFSTMLIRPYFTLFLENDFDIHSPIILGFIFSIPSIMAVLCFPILVSKHSNHFGGKQFIIALGFCFTGMLLQAYDNIYMLMVGRVVFGAALLFAQVGIDLYLFGNSSLSEYTKRFSQLHIFQNLGLLLAPIIAGLVLDNLGAQANFYLGSFLLCLSLIMVPFLKTEPSKSLELINH